VLFQISEVLGTGLERETLSLLLQLIELGVNPEALAATYKALKQLSGTSNEQTETANPIKKDE